MRIDGFITKERAMEILKQHDIKPSEVKKMRQFIQKEVVIQFKTDRSSLTIKL